MLFGRGDDLGSPIYRQLVVVTDRFLGKSVYGIHSRASLASPLAVHRDKGAS